ncbi:hypothetical protein A3D78_02485 [Candidatus Gottesmanbacteria bacterium RIFCSPHIGHO2_02_FULL_39_14]|uniref:Uncharacterized protein n=1 Tax=Candidatus Gottesmanbacteria bacterium RIFCSPHIGHO2_02_FULL_39_14 TaxID=1798383 RepID=A0A1F5ZTT6_9BACT|nr:MAG: hypothetical protein A3D78_02485 [Candidatus Gottesmanbacteria bacterium RIFCSPHIGHO2_02_FULL_39_14]
MFWVIVFISGIITFTTILAFHERLAYLALRVGRYKIHHSVFGLILVIAGRLITDTFTNILTASGLGMYLSHVIEEMYLNKLNLLKAIFTFITPHNHDR